jgi:type IV pilus assembly protein PilW
MKSRTLRIIKKAYHKGITLVELLVALVLVSLITLAALALYNSSSSTYRTTDANQELQDNARLVFDIFSQAIRQAGLQDSAQYAAFQLQNQAALPPSHVWDMARYDNQPALFGANNAKLTSTTDYGADNSGGYNNSDVFGVRYFGSSSLSDVATPDGSIINCKGDKVAYPIISGDIGFSLIQVATSSSGEPELKCTGKSNGPGASISEQPIVSGVETLQIVYAVDTDAGTTADSTPNRWLNAEQVKNGALWSKVRTVRIGMVLRGTTGSATGAPNSPALYPLGEDFSKVSGAVPAGEAIFTPPNDGRLRRAFTFNIAIRNNLEQ